MRAHWLACQLKPAAEVPGLDPSRLIPIHPQGPHEPEPAQQIHPIGTLCCRWPPTRGQLGEERRHRDDHRTVAVNEPVRHEQVARHLKRAVLRHHQPGQLPRHVPVVDHEDGT